MMPRKVRIELQTRGGAEDKRPLPTWRTLHMTRDMDADTTPEMFADSLGVIEAKAKAALGLPPDPVNPARAAIAGYLERLAHDLDARFGANGWQGGEVVDILAEDMVAYGVPVKDASIEGGE